MIKINRLREFRVKNDMSQIELSRTTGVAQATISNIESCNRTPSYLTRQRLANALNVSVEEIFPNEQDLGSKRARKKKGKSAGNAADIILVNSAQALSTKPLREDDRDLVPLIDDNKLIGFVTGGQGERLKYFSLKMFKGDEFVSSCCTDATGKFVFNNLKPGKYHLATNEGKLMDLRVK